MGAIGTEWIPSSNLEKVASIELEPIGQMYNVPHQNGILGVLETSTYNFYTKGRTNTKMIAYTSWSGRR